ncbi:MAG: SagB/ThcOx family dehydrogenase [Candidatus Izemoplasma sp.]|nr:SagB/ThcOx family dehydrogenase [Candidatus Izemoplasma sp.]
MTTKERIERNRKAIKENWKDLREIESDRHAGKERPPQFKEPDPEATLIEVLRLFPSIEQKTLTEVIKNRRSTRQYSTIPLTFEEVSYLLYETSRVVSFKERAVFRTIPTGGATNAMETYVYFNNVDGYDKGLYHYVQDSHELALLKKGENLEDDVNEALYQQLRGASVVFFFSAVPYRSEYKYAFCAHKMIAIEAGHAGQNLSLAAEVIDAGACAIAAYRQDLVDQLLNLDGEEEFATYAFTVGKK